MSSFQVNPFKRDDYVGKTMGLAVGGFPSAYLLYDSLKPVSDNDVRILQKAVDKIFPAIDTFDKTTETAERIIKNEGLADKGVKILITNNSEESTQKLNEILKNEKPKSLVKNIKKLMQNGCNGCFHNTSNTVMVNDKFGFSSIYHEIGHAKHFNSKNPLMKLLTKSRNLTPMGVSVIAPIALGVAMFHKVDKTKPKQDKTKTERTLDFVAKNAGKLTLASYVPLVLEEGLASVDGIKMAKKYLSQKQISKLKGSYFKAWSTYALTALGVSMAVGMGAALKDVISNRKQNKIKMA